MPRKRKVLNVKTHLEHIQLILDGYVKNGDSPLLAEEIKVARFINNAILEMHSAKSTRKDIRVPS